MERQLGVAVDPRRRRVRVVAGRDTGHGARRSGEGARDVHCGIVTQTRAQLRYECRIGAPSGQGSITILHVVRKSSIYIGFDLGVLCSHLSEIAFELNRFASDTPGLYEVVAHEADKGVGTSNRVDCSKLLVV